METSDAPEAHRVLVLRNHPLCQQLCRCVYPPYTAKIAIFSMLTRSGLRFGFGLHADTLPKDGPEKYLVVGPQNQHIPGLLISRQPVSVHALANMDGLLHPHQNRHPPVLLASLSQQTFPLVNMGCRCILHCMFHRRFCRLRTPVFPGQWVLDAYIEHPLSESERIISGDCDFGPDRRRYPSYPADSHCVEVEGR